jgi:cysteinyl-tRNA synthetase
VRIYNSLTKQKEDFIPREDPSTSLKASKNVKMFVCGPTVYDYIHIGNARTFVFFDMVAKYLKYRGYSVDYIQNITDIDDKIIQRANEKNIDSIKWAKDYTDKFKEDMKSLDVSAPRYQPATEHIDEMVKQVKTLIDKGFAYLIEKDGYYFDIKRFPDYGKLSGRTAEMADDAVSRIDESDKKRNAGDFALWKFSKEGEPSWDTELGKGRPGWHIEDTAITEHYFGPQYDLHGGGQDLIFPHHEAEITQQEAASGKKPFVKYWMHAAFVVNREEKMSKSACNFTTVHDLLKKYPKEVIRFYLLSNHYRSPLDFNEQMISRSQAGVNRIGEFAERLDKANGKVEIESEMAEAEESFVDALDDDFNTPEAYAAIFDLIRRVNPLLISNSLSKKSANNIKEFLEEVNIVLGIIIKKRQEIPKDVDELVKEREKYRKDKNWEEADKIRDQIKEKGYDVEDTAYGPLVN